MPILHSILDLVLHPRMLKGHLQDFAYTHQTGVYALIAAIVFCETGLVVTPFLPGDSLLFIIGALSVGNHPAFSLPVVIVLLCLSANAGDLLNYTLGYRVGPRVFSANRSLLFNRRHLEEAQRFYDRHGGKTIIMARFVPIIRTFAPFVAGIGRMRLARFAAFSVSGGILWVTLLTLAGYAFGQVPIVEKHFEMVVVAIVVISVLPAVFQTLSVRGARKRLGTSEAVEARASSQTPTVP